MRKALLPILADPELASLDAWTLAGRLALVEQDAVLAAYAYEALTRLEPRYAENPDLVRRLARLNRLDIQAKVRAIPAERAELLKDLAKARQGDKEAKRRVALAYGSGKGVVPNFAAAGEFDGGEAITNSIGMKLVLIPPGEFLMGSPAGEADRRNNETQHRVRLTKPFYLGATEVTQKQWREVMGTTIGQQRDKANSSWPLRGEGDDYPMYYVSWDEATEFCRKLSRKEGKSYRLPTEAEWEYACRAGTTGAYAGDLDAMGWYSKNSGDQTRPVGGKRANAWGLHDMHGNVWEWCADWYGDYPAGAVTDPAGPGNGAGRVLRGGSWYVYPQVCRSANRINYSPGNRGYGYGFRVALDFP